MLAKLLQGAINKVGRESFSGARPSLGGLQSQKQMQETIGSLASLIGSTGSAAYNFKQE